MKFQNLNSFIEYNSSKTIIVVQGLGFVGSVMSIVCANSLSKDYAVIGVDLNTEKSIQKIRDLNNGIFPLIAEDPKIGKFFENTITKNNFYATTDISAYSYAQVIIVDINLDVQKYNKNDFTLESFDVNLGGFKEGISTIGQNCKEDALILVETTVPPGTCEQVVKPIVYNKLSCRGLTNDKIKIAHSYERVMPGPDYIDSIQNYPRVYSGINKRSANAAEAFLKTIINLDKCELRRLESTTATEMAKVLENSYRATNIAFVVEWTRFAEEANVDLWTIVDAIRVRKTHSNLMYPGIGVGGYCLTKDPLLASWARKHFFGSDNDLEMSTKSVSTNDQMPIYAYNRLKKVFGQLDRKKLLLFGVSYRGDVGDTRFSPVEPLYRLLKTHFCEVILHDPYISDWEELNVKVISDVDVVLSGNLDIVIISTAHSIYKTDDFVSKLFDINNCKIFDTVGIFSKDQISHLAEKHEVSILGSGKIF